MSVCPSCGSVVPGGSAYCPACGSRQNGGAVATATPIPGASQAGVYPPGTLLSGRYRIVSLIGRGGMGEVYLADDLELSQQVALKFLPSSVAQRPGGLERFRTEARIARTVSHPNVARVHDVGQVDGRHFLSMEYVDGENLEQLLRRIGRLPHEKAVEIARQMCLGLAAAHDRGVLHRDLKPANVMIDGRGHVRLTDFGLAALAAEGLGEGEIVGTPAYMSPEQITGKEVTAQSDLYSLGLVLYEIFTGQPAFAGRSFGELRDSHQHDTPSLPSSIIAELEPAVERVIMKCLDKDPPARPRGARAVALGLPGGDPLAAALASGEIPAPEVVAAAGPIEGLSPLAAGAALFVFLILLVLGVALSRNVNLIEQVGTTKEAAVLLDRARELAAALGWPETPRDEAWWFDYDREILEYLRETSAIAPAERWRELSSGPAPVKFYYRSSPEPLADHGDGVRLDDPAPVIPGMLTIELDPRGRLVSFAAVPDPSATGEESLANLPWEAVLREADLDPTALRPAASPRLPPVFADRRESWDGSYPGRPELPLEVAAASYHGRLVHFEAGPPRERAVAPRENWPIWLLLTTLVLAGGLILAGRNLRLGRGNLKGALRVAVFVFLSRAAVWILAGNHPNGAPEAFDALIRQVAFALLVAFFTWVYYLALEPYVRRSWPEALIPWSRLLAGRLRDPLLGRDVLVGGIWGLAAVSLACLRRMAPEWLHWGAERPALVSLTPLRGWLGSLGVMTQLAGDAVLLAMILVFLLVLFRVLLRRTWLAEVAWMLAFAAVILAWVRGTVGAPLIGPNVAYAVLLSGSLLFLIVRFGLLAAALGIFFGLLVAILPVTSELDAWYAYVTGLAGAVAVALACWGFHLALAGRPLIPPR